MDKAFEKMIKVNTQGRVFVVCQSRGVTDPAIVRYYVEIVEQAIVTRLSDDSTTTDFQRVMEEQLTWLEGELDQTRPGPAPAVAEANGEAEEAEEIEEIEEAEAAEAVEEVEEVEEVEIGDEAGIEPEEEACEAPDLELDEALSPKEEKKPTGYVPEAKAMPEKLKDRRSIMEHLLDNDCITLKLVTPNEAKEYKHGLLGKEPEKAEEELVTALRNVLYSQVRKFIRKHNGGPWASATLQHEVRMDITRTKSLRSLITLARELLSEREEWLNKTKGSITGRFFGGRVKMDK